MILLLMLLGQALMKAKWFDETFEMVVQVNGKVKGTVSIALDTDEAIVKEKVHENQSVKKCN